MKISEIFLGLQGEGDYCGEPAIFVRTSGCNRNCWFCDTKYAQEEYTEMSCEEVAEKITTLIEEYYKDKDCKIPSYDIFIIFTGGEPTLWINDIKEIIKLINIYFGYSFICHLETNGTYLNPDLFGIFNFITFSPKTEEDAINIWKFVEKYEKVTYEGIFAVKVATDGKVNEDLIKYADILMPLTTFEKNQDDEIKKKVWDMCLKLGKKYSPRLQIDLFGKKRGV